MFGLTQTVFDRLLNQCDVMSSMPLRMPWMMYPLRDIKQLEGGRIGAIGGKDVARRMYSIYGTATTTYFSKPL